MFKNTTWHLHGHTVHQWYQTLYNPTNAHYIKNLDLLKHFKIKAGFSNMFRFTRKPSSGSHSQYLAKITHLVHCEYMEVVQRSLVLWLHSTTCEACVLCSCNTDNICSTSMYTHWTECVILAKYWLWLPDDGFTVNRNMLEQSPLF